MTHRVYQSCDSLCTCAEAVQFSLHGKMKFHFSRNMVGNQERDYFRNIKDIAKINNGMYRLPGSSNFTQE